jgi:hypothetical protein
MAGCPCLLAGLLLLAAPGHALGPAAGLTAAALLADVAGTTLLGRIRGAVDRPSGYWTQSAGSVVPLLALSVGWLIADPGRLLGDAPAAGWYPVALAGGVALVLAAPVDLAALRSGDLAFLAGPTRPYRAGGRLLAICTAPLTEEVAFRGLPAGWAAGPVRFATLGLAAAAFVARHHLQARAAARGFARMVGYEVAAAAVLVGLAVGAGSVWPAVLAHAVGNVPGAVLQVQRARAAGAGLAAG